MSWGPLQPADTHFSTAQAPAFADSGHRPNEALALARQVFLAGNGLPGRWAGQRRFVVLETGFGLGHNFLATWAAWQADAQRCDQLWYLAIDKHPPRQDDLARAHAQAPLPAQAAALQAAWPPLTPDLHAVTLDGGRVHLLLAWGDIATVLPEWLASVDAFYLDGFAPGRNPAMWDTWRLRRLPRLAAPGATLATWCVAEPLRQGLRAAGFAVDTVDTAGTVEKAGPGANAMAFTVARFAPRFASPPPPGQAVAKGVQRVAVVGAGLAGAAVAQALAGRGLQVTVFDRQPHCAGETSGNPGGLFHGIVHGADGPHARWLRAAALHGQRVLAPLLADGRVAGCLDGLLRGEQALDGPAMQALLQRLALPADYVQVVADDAAGLADTATARWLYPGGGWVSPADLCAAWLQTPGITTRYGQPIQALRPTGQGGWQLLDGNGLALAEAHAVVLCNAADATRLLGPVTAAALGGLQRVRGQTTLLPANTPGLPQLPQPWADGGYALRLADGRLLCGATSQVGDEDPVVREADHAHNIAALRRLTGWVGQVDMAALQGRVGWRLQSEDRLPLLGPVPDVLTSAGQRRADQPRFVPRLPGLWLFTALGSRGITQAALGGEVLASWLTGDPVPLPASLLDAVDAARFVSRAVRRAG